MPTIAAFDEWSSAPGFDISVGGGTYSVPPRGLDDWKLCVAAAVVGQFNLGIPIVKSPDDPRSVEQVLTSAQALLKTIKPGEHPAIGDVYGRMLADGVPVTLADRVAYYAVFLVALGKEYADNLSDAIWPSLGGSGEPAPKG